MKLTDGAGETFYSGEHALPDNRIGSCVHKRNAKLGEYGKWEQREEFDAPLYPWEATALISLTTASQP